MAEVFAGTSGLASYFVATEPHHDQAMVLVRRWKNRKVRIVTTNYVLLELSALLTSPLRVGRSRRIEILDEIRGAPWGECVHINTVLDADAWSLLRSRPDKDWSLADCASFVVMRRRGIAEALTNDHHFEQAGFLRLLKT